MLRWGRAFAPLPLPSRMVGLVLLVVGLTLQLSAGDRGLAWRTAFWDTLHRLAPRERGPAAEAPAVVVAIDEETMRQNGPWPWPRNRLAELVERIGALGASAVVLDMVLENPDPQSPAQLAAEYRARGVPEVAQALEPLGDTDAVLFAALRSVPSVLPVAGIAGAIPGNHGRVCDFPPPPVNAPEPLPRLAGVYYLAALPLPLLLEQAPGLAEIGLGAITFRADRGFVVRRVEAVQRICGDLVLMPGPEALRVGTGAFFATVRPTWSGLEVVLGDPADPEALRFPTERDGTFWLHFGPLGDARDVAARYIPAHRLFHPTFDPAQFAGRVVFVTVLELGTDERMSPLAQVISGVETHVQMVEQILSGDFLRRPWFMVGVEAALLLLGGFAVIALVPAIRPEHSAGLIAAGILVLLLAGYIAFRAGLLLDAATPAIGAFVVTAGVLTVTLFERDRARLLSELALAGERADRAELQGELDAAARMQRVLLPARRLLVPGRLDLAAHIDPARQVGGDFYDHVMLDDRHLFFLVADVSGKGADASQFMLLCKTLWKSMALRHGPPLETIQREANAEITRENAATMFVTGFCGLLCTRTGELAYSSAGHDAPFLFGRGRVPTRLEIESGPPLGLVPGIGYPVGHCRLAPGDRLCLFSDGISEAMDASGELFGTDRLRDALAGIPPQADSAAAIAHILDCVAAFIGRAEQSDDLTLMVLSLPPDAELADSDDPA